jgi:hypothetical protein
MDLIDRYLAAVRRDLPAAKADDIIAELRDDLMTRKEDREEALGRALAKDETSALLRDIGHPLMVASRYRKHQYLIGPDGFPFYLATMRIVLLVVGAVLIAIGVARILLGDQDLVQALLQTWASVWGAAVTSFAIVTIVFAVLERNGFPAEHLAAWVPDQLPDLKQKQPGRWESAFEVAMGIAFLLWWTGVIAIPYSGDAGNFRLEPAPFWATLYWPVLILAAARLVHNLIQWLRRRWTIVHGLLGAATAIGGVALLVMIYQAGHWADVVPTGMAAAQAAQLEESLNLALRIAIVVVAVIWTLGSLGALWQMVRGWRERA